MKKVFIFLIFSFAVNFYTPFVQAGSNFIISDDQSKKICKEILDKDKYKAYEKGINLLRKSPYTSNYQTNYDECVKSNKKLLGQISKYSVELALQTLGKGYQEFATAIKENTENIPNGSHCAKFLTLDLQLKAQGKQDNNPKQAYQGRQSALEYFAKYPNKEKLKEKVNSSNPSDIEEEIAACTKHLRTSYAGNIINSPEEIDNRVGLLNDFFDDRKERIEKEKNSIINLSEQSEIICKHQGLLGQTGDEGCDALKTAISSDGNSKSGEWTRFMSLFVGSGVDDGHNGYLSINQATKSYCKNCMKRNFETAVLLHDKGKFNPKTKLGKLFKDEVKDILKNKKKINNGNKKAKQKSENAWMNIKEKMNTKLFKELTYQKVSKELVKTTELLQQMYHFKAMIPEKNHAQLENSFSCYNTNKITDAIKKSCKGDGHAIKDAKERLEESFGKLLGSNLSGKLFIFGGFEKAFETLKEKTQFPNDKDERIQCKGMTREQYAKAQQGKYTKDGTKRLADFILDTTFKSNKESSSKNLKMLKEDEITPMEYIAEEFIEKIYANVDNAGDTPKKDDIFSTLVWGQKNEIEKTKNQEINRVFDPLVRTGIIPLSKYIPVPPKAGNKSPNLKEHYRKYIKAMIMDQMLKVSKVDPNFYALNFNKKELLRTMNGFKKSKAENKYFSAYVKFGDELNPENNFSNELDRFEKIQKVSCDTFINSIAKFSCAPKNNFKNFSRNDIDGTIKKLANKNEQNKVGIKYEKLLTDIALGSLSCEHKSAMKSGETPYNGEDQLKSLDEEIPPFAQSDLTARNREHLGLDKKKTVADNLSNYAKSKNNCAQVELAAVNFDCENNLLNDEKCFDKRKKLSKELVENKDVLEQSVQESDTNKVISQETNSSDAITEVLETDEGSFSHNQGNVYNQVTSDLTGNEGLVEVSNLEGLQYRNNFDFDDENQDFLYANTFKQPVLYTIEQNTTPSTPIDWHQTVSAESQILIPEVKSIDDSAYGQKTSTAINDSQSIQNSSKKENKMTTNKKTSATIKTAGHTNNIDLEDVKSKSTSYSSGIEYNESESSLRSPPKSNFKTIQTQQYSGNQFISNMNINPDTYNESVIDTNGNEYFRKNPEVHKNDYNYLNNNNTALNNQLHHLKDAYSDNPNKVSEVEKLEKKYKELLRNKVEALKKEVKEIKTNKKSQIAIDDKKEVKMDFVSPPSTISQKKINSNTNNIRNIATNTISPQSTYIEKIGSHHYKQSSTLSAGKTGHTSDRVKGNSITKTTKSQDVSPTHPYVSVSTNAMNSGDISSVSKELNGYLKLVKDKGGSAIEQSQLIDIQYIEIPGKSEKVPYAVIIGDNGQEVKVPLDEEHIEKDLIDKILTTHKKIVKNAQEEHEKIIEQEVYLESLKKEIALIQAQAALDLGKLKEINP